MFAVLEEYRDANYWRAHTTLCLELADGPHLYKIFAVVEAELTPENLGSYYALTGAGGPSAPEAHAAYAAFLKEQALYATGVEPAPGAKLLTLSTCTNISPNGRLLVAACEIPPAA